MGANAAEFQWEPSFVEQKQQACLFSFSVGDVAKEAHVFVQAKVEFAHCTLFWAEDYDVVCVIENY